MLLTYRTALDKALPNFWLFPRLADAKKRGGGAHIIWFWAEWSSQQAQMMHFTQLHVTNQSGCDIPHQWHLKIMLTQTQTARCVLSTHACTHEHAHTTWCWLWNNLLALRFFLVCNMLLLHRKSHFTITDTETNRHTPNTCFVMSRVNMPMTKLTSRG